MTARLDAGRLRRIGAFFRRAVDAGDLPGWSVTVDDGTGTVYADHSGLRDLQAGLPVGEDTVFRLFSMTKPVTAVAAMVLYERGELDLRTPLAEFVPEFADTPVLRAGGSGLDDVEPQRSPVAVWHALSHTAGLTYSFFGDPAAAAYRSAGLADPSGPRDLAATCRALAQVPLLFQAGTSWNYSMGTDVVGRVVEVVSGQPLDCFLQDAVLAPLGMHDTGFAVPPDAADRLAVLYEPGDAGLTPAPWVDDAAATRAPAFLSGGAGLFSTVPDYQRLVSVLAAGGAVDGDRLLGPETVRYLSANHLPGAGDLQDLAFQNLEWDLTGLGFGLGVTVVRDAVARRVLSRPGEFWWNGAGGGTFLVDPASGVSATFLTSVRAASNHRWEDALHQLLHQALTD